MGSHCAIALAQVLAYWLGMGLQISPESPNYGRGSFPAVSWACVRYGVNTTRPFESRNCQMTGIGFRQGDRLDHVQDEFCDTSRLAEDRATWSTSVTWTGVCTGDFA